MPVLLNVVTYSTGPPNFSPAPETAIAPLLRTGPTKVSPAPFNDIGTLDPYCHKAVIPLGDGTDAIVVVEASGVVDVGPTVVELGVNEVVVDEVVDTVVDVELVVVTTVEVEVVEVVAATVTT